ncbi:F-box/kelch-repeat protein-like protein [Tanacetum coccineum]
MEVHIPHDVVSNHILPRVPAKSLCRFKCVSKEWHSFLTSDMFKNKHNRHVDDHKNNLKLLSLFETKSSFEFATIDCEVPRRRKGLTPTRRPLPQFGDTTPGDIDILTSFHGLVCLGIKKYKYDAEYSGLILWNPLTNEYKRLSKYNSHKIRHSASYWKFRLYYSCCEDDYKLLLVKLFDDHVYIYSLKSDSWRKVDAFQHTSRLGHELLSRGTYLQENLYFLQENSNNRRLSSIIRFDTKTECFSKIETPYVDRDAYNYFPTMVVKSDCIHVCVKYDIYMSCDNSFGRTTCIELWKLDEYGKMKEVVTYQLRPRVYNDQTISSLIPFHLMKNGKWLMRNCSSREHKIYEVDLKKKKHYFKDKGKGKGKGKERGNICDEFEYKEVNNYTNNNNNIVDEEIRYTETFVSPNRYMK